MTEEEFKNNLKNIGIIATDLQLIQLKKYYQLLCEWNKKMNLTRIIEKEDVYLKHFYDSLTIVKIIDLKMINNMCDVGTGAGFPGIVIKIFFPQIDVTLIDSLNKRVVFLNEVIYELQLNNINVIHGRIEDYAKNNISKFDLVVARAVAPLNVLLEYCIPIVKVGKNFVAMKGDISQEILNSQKALKILKCSVVKIKKFELPIEQSKRSLISIKKETKTPSKYPREFKHIKNNPL